MGLFSFLGGNLFGSNDLYDSCSLRMQAEIEHRYRNYAAYAHQQWTS